MPAIGRQHDARLAGWRSGRSYYCCLQRNPDSEEPETPLIEAGIPHGSLLIAPVIDRAVSPVRTGRGERPVPRGSRRRTGSPGPRPVAPWGPMEVAALGISVPRATGSTGAARPTRSALRSAWVVGPARAAGAAWVVGPARATGPAGTIGTARMAGATWPARPARPALRSTGATWPTRSALRSARSARSARTTRAAGTTRTARIAGCVGRVDAPGRGCAVVTGRARRRPARSGAGRTGPHTQRRSAQCTGDGHPPKKLLKSHSPSPV